MSRASAPNAVDVLMAAGVALLAIALQLPTFDRTMSLLDEGHILQFADLLHRGGELYRDATLLPLPGAFELLALVFDVTGPSIRAARWLVVLEFGAFAAIVFLLMRQLAGRGAAWAGVGAAVLYKVWAFPHWQMYSYSTTAQVLLAGALALVVRNHERPSSRLLAIAGFITGLAIVVKQDYGGAGLLAMNAALWLAAGVARPAGAPGRLATLAWFNGPVLAVGALTALHYASQDLLGLMLQQTLLNHLQGISSGEYTTLPPILPLFEANPLYRGVYGLGAYTPAIVFTVDWARVGASAFFRESVLWDWCIETFFHAPYLIAGAGIIRVIRGRAALRDPARRSSWLGEATLVAAATAWIAALNRPVDWVHVAVLYWPALLLLVLWTSTGLARLAPTPRRVAGVALATVITLVSGYSLQLQLALRAQFDTPLRGERAGVFVGADEEAVIGGAVDWLRSRTRPGDRAAVLPYFPLISFLAERDSPHPEAYTLWPIEYDPERQPAVIRALERDADAAVYHVTQAAQLPRMREFTPQLFEYLVDHWTIEKVFSDPGWGYMLAGLRRVGPPPGTPLLALGDPLPTVVIEDARGARRAVAPERAAERVRTELWPFRRVIALEPSCGTDRTVLTLPLDVPTGARLESAVGVDPAFWFRYPPSAITWEIRIVDGATRTMAFHQRLDPHRRASDRRWVEVDLDLAPWAGRRVNVELTTQCETATGRNPAMGGFEIPRLVTPAPLAEGLAGEEELWQSPTP